MLCARLICFVICLSLICGCYSQSTVGHKEQDVEVGSIRFPNAQTAFIIGPQARAGSDPMASYFDEVVSRRAVFWAKDLLGKDYNNRTPDGGDDLTVAQNHYDLALCLYVLHYRTGDPVLLDYARKVADRWWESQFVGLGSWEVPGPSRPGPLYSGLAGLMLRALDGRPEMWGYIDEQTRQMMNTWIVGQIQSPRLYSDLRDLGYIQLYAVQLAKVLPDKFDIYRNGSNKPATEHVTDGSKRRAQYLADAERAAVDYFGRLQQPDGGWRWQLWQPDPMIPTGTPVEQPFMLGIYLESVVALHQLTQKESVKASLVNQLTRACRHLYEEAYLKTQVPEQRYRYRAIQYWYPMELNKGQYYADRHLHTSTIHAFGYAYKVTGDSKFKQWGDELWDASFGSKSDGMRGLLDSTSHTKEFTMEVRSAPRYLIWRRGNEAASQAPVAPLEPSTPKLESVSADTLLSSVLAEAISLSASELTTQELQTLFDRIVEVQRLFATERDLFLAPDDVLIELDAALGHARNALKIVTSSGSNGEAKLRVEWTAARLDRAKKRMRRRSAAAL
jgi:hypothetical protein